MINYDRLADEYAFHRRVHPEALANLLGACLPGPEFSVLEVGCGTGNYIGEIARTAGCVGFGVDPSEPMLEQARKRWAKVRFQAGHGEKLEFPDGFFDLVFSVDVIHHVKERLGYFREAHRALRRGGKLCTVTDSEWVIRNRLLSRYFPETVDLELARYPSVSNLRVIMKAAGFQNASEKQVESAGELVDLGPYRDRVFSALRLIPREAFQRGIERMEKELAQGPIKFVSRYLMLWGEKR